MVLFVAGLIVSYLIGSIPTSYIVGMKGRGVDLRQCGSGNLGATNAFRVLGWKMGLLVLVLDMLKGFLPTFFLPLLIVRGKGIGLAPHNLSLLFGLAAITGHVFTIFMRFKGGKGVATSMGVFLALTPIPFAITLIVSLGIVKVSRYVSLGSLIGAILLPLLVYILQPERPLLFIITAVVGLLVIVRHRANISRLIRGEEHKIFP